MGLLHKRPLALFCVCFLVALYGATYCSSAAKLLFLAVAAVMALLFLLLSFWHEKRRVRWIAVMLCLIAVALAFLHAYVIDRRKEAALEHTGKRTVECQVISVSYSDEWHTECVAELLQIGEDRVRIRTYLICGFSADLHAGDRMLARVELIEPDTQAYGVRATERTSDSRILLATVLHEEMDGTLLHCAETASAWSLLSEPNGIELISDRLREVTAALFDRALGKEISPLARSFFIGDKDGLSPRVIRDFRRTGTSHLLAVSGLHITLLLGGLEWILRKLTLPKGVRMAAVSVAGLLLLMATGFSMSACRSVLMLFAVYFHYLFARENDAVTSLLVAVTLILVIAVDAVWDIGLWMSFFATLGLLTVYPMLDARIPRKLFAGPFGHIAWRVLRFAIMTVLMSVVTGLFLLPIQWSVFRELSLVAIPANLVLAPLGTFYLCVIPIALLLSVIPWLGAFACGVLSLTGEAMIAVLGFFSEQNFAMLSLRYRFASVVIPLLAGCTALFLLIRLRRKWLMALPPILAVICFAVCLAVTFRTEAPIVTDYTNGKQRFLALTDNGESVLCDLSCETSNAYFDAAEALWLQGATDIDGLVLTHLSEEHAQMLETFLPYTVVHRLYLPKSLAEEQIALARELGDIAQHAGCEVFLYEDETLFFAENAISVQTNRAINGHAAALSLACNGQCVTYADPLQMTAEERKTWLSRLCESHTVLFAIEACNGEETVAMPLTESSVRQIALDLPHGHQCVTWEADGIPIYRYPEDTQKRTLTFFLTP